MPYSSDGKEVGKFILGLQVLCRSGLHTGAGRDDAYVRGIDSPIMRNPVPMDCPPFSRGTGFKDKVRDLLVLFFGLPAEAKHSESGSPGGNSAIRRHACPSGTDLAFSCPVCFPFGKEGFPGRLGFHSFQLCSPKDGHAEVKAENCLTRLQLQANPRFIERLSAGSQLQSRIVGSILLQEMDRAYTMLQELLLGLRLLEDDTLGGLGSRGYGWIACTRLEWELFRFSPKQPPASQQNADRFVHQWPNESEPFAGSPLLRMQQFLSEELTLERWRSFFTHDESDV